MPLDELALTPEQRELLAEVRRGVDVHDPARYPVQHATARFHLGTTLLGLGDAQAGADHLRAARDLFPVEGMAVEHAKATNMLGVALRDLGRAEAALEAFDAAGQLFRAAGHQLEWAASEFNRALVLRDAGRPQDAVEPMRGSLATFEEADAREQAAAAARELGALLLEAGRLQDAADTLGRARDLARRAGDRAGLGAAANVLGVVLLQDDRPAEAVTAFQDAVGAHPRGVRPTEHAMARANLALAHERCGQHAHARLAARQALALPADGAVREQAAAILDRLGVDDAAVVDVLRAGDDAEAATGVLRAELLRALPHDDELAGLAGVLVEVLADPEPGLDQAAVCEALLEVLLERPPAEFQRGIEAVAGAVRDVADATDRDRARRQLSSAMAHFHVPQWMRLKDTFRSAGQALGDPDADRWG